MTEESLTGYKRFSEIRKNVREEARKELEKFISDAITQLKSRYIHLRKSLPKKFIGIALPDYSFSSKRKISLKGNGVWIDKERTSVNDYFEECLNKCEDIELKYDFLDSAYRTLLMWEGYFKREEMKERVFTALNNYIEQKGPPTNVELTLFVNEMYSATFTTTDISETLNELGRVDKVEIHSVKPVIRYEIKKEKQKSI